MTLNLTRPQKAAAILVAMGKPSAGKLLKFFKQEELKALIDAARALRTIPQGDLERIVAEFEAEFAEGAGLLDSADKMDTIINESLTPEEVSIIRGEREAKPADDNQPPPVWPALETLEPARLGTFLAGEHPQTAALVLCNMAPQSAAGVLMTLPKPVRGEVVKRMLAMNSVPEKAKRIVEDQIRSRVLSENSAKDNSAGQARVASLLNELDKEQLEEVIEDMQAAGASDIEAVKARLFSFDDIVLLSQKARVTLFDGIASDLVTTALRQCGGELKESILSALGQRARRMIESELSMEAQGVTAADILKARKTIAATALRLAGDRLLELPSAESVPEAA
jgi:flagellar motor switch protein FliG